MVESGQHAALVKCITRRFLRLHRLLVDHLRNKRDCVTTFIAYSLLFKIQRTKRTFPIAPSPRRFSNTKCCGPICFGISATLGISVFISGNISTVIGTPSPSTCSMSSFKVCPKRKQQKYSIGTLLFLRSRTFPFLFLTVIHNRYI